MSGKYELTPYQRAVLICAQCRQDDQLYRDAHGVFCRRCGPSVALATREIGQMKPVSNTSKP